MGFVSERAVKCDTKVGLPIVVPQQFPISNDVQLLVNSSTVQVESARYSLDHTRLLSPEFRIFADPGNVSVDGGVLMFKRACLVGKANVQ